MASWDEVYAEQLAAIDDPTDDIAAEEKKH